MALGVQLILPAGPGGDVGDPARTVRDLAARRQVVGIDHGGVKALRGGGAVVQTGIAARREWPVVQAGVGIEWPVIQIGVVVRREWPVVQIGVRIEGPVIQIGVVVRRERPVVQIGVGIDRPVIQIGVVVRRDRLIQIGVGSDRMIHHRPFLDLRGWLGRCGLGRHGLDHGRFFLVLIVETIERHARGAKQKRHCGADCVTRCRSKSE